MRLRSRLSAPCLATAVTAAAVTIPSAPAHADDPLGDILQPVIDLLPSLLGGDGTGGDDDGPVGRLEGFPVNVNQGA
jgi:hypothetical protein